MMNNANEPSPRLRIAIVGGGIGGLALATFLAAKNISDIAIDIYEANASLTELGAGVALWLRTWRILTSAGLAEDLQRIAPPRRDMGDGLRKAFEFRMADRNGPEGRSFYTMEVPFSILTLHRAEFQQALAKHAIPPAVPHFGKKLVDYTNEGQNNIALRFSDGSTAHADVIIGADGIRSPTRGVMLHNLAKQEEQGNPVKSCSAHYPDTGKHAGSLMDLIDPIWSGTNVYRCLIPASRLEERFPGHRSGKGPVVYMGKNKHVLTFPIMQPINNVMTPMVNLVAFVSEPELEGTQISGAWVRPGSATDLLSTFESGSWEDEVQALIELVDKPLLWAIHTLKPLPCFTDANGRVALLGDAAHAMTPHQGAGGGQAIEDAYVLAALLADSRTTRETLPAALRAYDAVRVPEAQRVVESSRLNGRMYELNEVWGDNESSLPESDSVLRYEVEMRGSVTNGEEDDEEMRKLRRLAAHIMAIHDWEWAPAPASEDDQPARALRIFEAELTR